MEPRAVDISESAAAEAAFQAYRDARRAQASRSIADDVALARYRAYFPLATRHQCRSSMRTHLAAKRSAHAPESDHGRSRPLVLTVSH
jgi:hypothetical protein